MKQSQLLLIGVIVLAVIGGGVILSMKKSSPAMNTEQQTAVMSPTIAAMEAISGTSGASNSAAQEMTNPAAATTFTVTGSNFSFDTKEIKVKKGDKVTVTFKNSEGFHDWNLDEFNAHTQKLQAGKEETVSFTADKTGTFEYYCSVGNHRKMGMVGNLIVE